MVELAPSIPHTAWAWSWCYSQAGVDAEGRMKAALLLMDGNKVFHPDCIGKMLRVYSPAWLLVGP